MSLTKRIDTDADIGIDLLLTALVARINLAEGLSVKERGLTMGEIEVRKAEVEALKQEVTFGLDALPEDAPAFVRRAAQRAGASRFTLPGVVNGLRDESISLVGRADEALVNLRIAFSKGDLEGATACGQAVAKYAAEALRIAYLAYRTVRDARNMRVATTNHDAVWLAYDISGRALRVAELLGMARANWLAGAQRLAAKANGANSED